MVNHRKFAGSRDSFISLGDIDPDLLDGLQEPERSDAARVLLPLLDVSDRTVELPKLLANAGAFGAILLEGVVEHHMRIGEQPGLRLLSPGEIISVRAGPSPSVVAASEWRAGAGTRLALLGDELLVAGRRWPEVFMNLQVRRAEQIDRLVAQVAICQLPRVEDRLLAMLWLLADSWGRVTSAGTTVPLSLTHETLGELIGARRSTVTLAIRELAERGAVVHQEHGWLLLQALPGASGEAREIDAQSQRRMVSPRRFPRSA